VLIAVLSLIVPGLGHMLNRSFRRGLILLAAFATIVGLLIWRIQIVGRREVGAVAMALKSFELRPILLAVAVGLVALYVWVAVDAFLAARRRTKGVGGGLWTLLLVLYFALGWQIGEIEPLRLIREARDAAPFMLRIAWPWEEAIHREEMLSVGVADVQVPCVGEPPPPTEPIEGQPWLLVEPTCGDLTAQDGTPGTTLTVIGRAFAPDTLTEMYWRDDMRNEFRHRQAGEYVQVTTDSEGNFELELTMPYRLIAPSEAREFALWQLQARQLAALGSAEPSEVLLLAIEKMIETIFLGMMATLFGIILSLPVSFLAAKNLMSGSGVTLAIYYLTRTVLNIIRSIEPLIWAVIAIIVVGLGPFAGIVALTVHSIAALGKLYSEAIESIDPGPIEAIHATGANWLQTIMYGVVPQVIPPFVSFTIYRWDINVRMSTVIGLVGGGGIGFLLIQWIHLLDYEAAGIAVWFIAITVAILDYVSSEIRQRFV
jgi:phosphonate transport system permease protein